MQQEKLVNLTTGREIESTKAPTNLVLFFQHHTGEIRWMIRMWPDLWRGGSVNEVVATDAKDRTPISVRGSLGSDGTHEWHVFCKSLPSLVCHLCSPTIALTALPDVGDDNTLKQRTFSNVTNTWNGGLLIKYNINTLDSERVGLRVCFYDGPIGNLSLAGTDGLRLWVATSETTFEQWVWRSGLPDWLYEQTWRDMNAHASPACNPWMKGTTDYIAFVNAADMVDVYWLVNVLWPLWRNELQLITNAPGEIQV